MKKVFVCYTLRDIQIGLDALSWLNTKLSEYFNVFIDLIHNNSVNKQERVESELLTSDVVVVIVTKLTFESEWVRREIELARMNKIPVMELSLLNCENNEMALDHLIQDLLYGNKQ